MEKNRRNGMPGSVSFAMQGLIVAISLLLCFGCNQERIKWWVKVIRHGIVERIEEEQWQK